MTQGTRNVAVSVLLLALMSLAQTACNTSGPSQSESAAAPKSQIPERPKEQMVELGRQHKTAADLYRALKEEAKGGQRLAANNLPDWTGVYTRQLTPGFSFDGDQPPGGLPPAKLTPEYHAKMMKRIEDLKKGIEWDPISACVPPGHPRWLTEPFLREFVVTPDQTWLINEMINDIRRIYTDGRDHIPEEDRYPLINGDSIGFWDGHKLVIHTNQLQAGIYQRAQPDYTDQVETVEIWQKVDDKTVRADVWVYDPPALEEAWFSKQTYSKLSDPEKNLRIRYWNCAENQNNAVVQTQQGGTEFRAFTFTKKNDKQGDKQ